MEQLKSYGGYAETLVLRVSDLAGTQADYVRLFAAILSGFPCAIIYRCLISHFTPVIRHLYFMLCGLGLLAWNFGGDVSHLIINTLLVYLALRFIKSPRIYVPLVFVFNLTYLLVGYFLYNTRTDEYVVNWTTPHCVLCLRLTGLAFDVADGRKYDKLRDDLREAALRERPSALQTFAYAFFFGGSLVGPQFSCKRYLDFVNGDLIPVQLSSYIPNCIFVALGRFGVAVICLGSYEVFHMYFHDEYLLSDNFKELNVVLQAIYVTLWGYVMLHKYLSVWLMSEGVCTACGLSYSGPSAAAVQSELDRSGTAGIDALVTRWKSTSQNENKDWFTACSNVHFRKFEFSASGNDVIGSFNLTTNRWAANYVFRRLRFLNSRFLSHTITLAFLALWHGFYSGYYVCFAIEFTVVTAERLVASLLKQLFPGTMLKLQQSTGLLQFSIWLLRKFLFQFGASFALVAFVLLDYRLWLPIYRSMYFIGFHHTYAIIFAVLLKMVLPKRRSKEKADGDSKSE